MAYLFNKDRLAQSLRLGFAGAWSYEYPFVSHCLAQIHSRCPRLSSSFTASFMTDALDTTNTTEMPCQYATDFSHSNIRGFNNSATKATDFLHNLQITIPTRGFVQSGVERFFYSKLVDAYARDYRVNCYGKLCNINLFDNIRFENGYVILNI
jgi:hypothetical protein